MKTIAGDTRSAAWRRVVAAAAYLLALSSPLPALAQGVPLRRFGTTDGLAQSQVSAVIQDSTGYLWVATWGGASRFGGRRFDNFGPAQGLNDILISAAAAGPDGTVWFGGESGAHARWDGQRMQKSPWGGLPATQIAGLWAPRPSELWVGYPEAGLWRCRGDRCERVLSVGVRSIVAGRRPGEAWLASPQGLWRLTDHGAESVPLPGCAHPCPVAAAAESLEGRLFVGLEDGRVLELASGTAREAAAGMMEIRALLSTSQGLWIGTFRGLFLVEPGERARRIRLRQAAANDLVAALYEDQEGSVWVGTWGDGLYQAFARGITTFTAENGLPDLTVWDFLEAPDGCLWMAGSSIGIFERCGDRWGRRIDEAGGLPGNRTRSLAWASDGSLWAGTTRGVARMVDGRVVDTWTREDGLPDDTASALLAGEDGSMWASTRTGGLARYSRGRWQTWGLGHGLPTLQLRGLARDASGTLWIATRGGGVVSFDGERFTTYGREQGLPDLGVWCVMVDSRQRVWAGTDQGVWLFTPGSAARPVVTSSQQGLPHPTVLFLVEDRQQAVWAGTTNGVARLRPDGSVDRVLTVDDGLTESEAQLKAALVDRRGHLWFGMSVGVNRVAPDALAANTRPPRLILERVLVNDRPTEPDPPGTLHDGAPSLDLAPDQSDIECRAAALTFVTPARVEWRWVLAGHDRGWSEPMRLEDSIRYRRLPPGRYELRATAHNGAGVWATEPLVLAVRVRPPWYRTPASHALAGLTILFVIGAIHRLRVRRLEARERDLALRVEEALSRVRVLSGLLPICSWCKKVRDDQGYWGQIEAYVSEHSDAEFTHGICPECTEKFFPGVEHSAVKGRSGGER